MTENVLLSGILSESVVNGEGLRCVLFAQMCKHNCKGCFNPETHSPDGGEWFNLDDLLTKIKSNPILSGVTFSGGDPFEQADKFAYLASHLRQDDFTIWCYTGYTYEYILQNKEIQKGWHNLLTHIDVLVDGPFIEDMQDGSLKFRGSKNQRLINVPLSLKENKVITLNF